MGGGGARNSVTVDRIAVVISALDVYGKQMFRTVLESRQSNRGEARAMGDLLVVVSRPGNSLVDDFQHILADHLALPENAHTCTVAVKYVSVCGELLELDLGELHKPLDLMFRAVEVLNAKGVDCDNFDAASVANLHDLDGAHQHPVDHAGGFGGQTLASASKPRW